MKKFLLTGSTVRHAHRPELSRRTGFSGLLFSLFPDERVKGNPDLSADLRRFTQINVSAICGKESNGVASSLLTD
jgi:hypothetical protein